MTVSGRKSNTPDKSDNSDKSVVPEQSGSPDGDAIDPNQALLARLAALEADNARLREEVAAEKARKVRIVAKGRFTPLQARVVQYYVEHPNATPAEAFVAAGATASSHGLMWRLVELDRLRIVVPEHMLPKTDSGDKPDSGDKGDSGDVSDSADKADTPVEEDKADESVKA